MIKEDEEEEDAWTKRVKSIQISGLYNELKVPIHEKSKLATDVAKDVPRSFGGQASSEEEKEAMTEVLTAFGKWDDGEGYTQGMGFIVCFALRRQSFTNSQARENAFWLLVDASKRLPKGFFSNAAHEEVFIFQEFIKIYAPAISDHLQSELLPALCYLIPRWFLSFFVFTMPENMTLAVWNELLFPCTINNNEVEETTSSDRKKLSSSSSNDLVVMLHKIAFALVEIHSGRILSEVRVVQTALSRVSKRNSGTELEATLLQSRDSRFGMEFMQKIVDSTLLDSNHTRLISLVKNSSITQEKYEKFRSIQVSKLNATQLRLKAAIVIQKWFRLREKKRNNKKQDNINLNKPPVKKVEAESNSNEFFEGFQKCIGIGRKPNEEEETLCNLQ